MPPPDLPIDREARGWTRTAPTEPGWYWCKVSPKDKHQWPCQVWRDERGKINYRNWAGEHTSVFGPAIPSADTLTRLIERAQREAVARELFLRVQREVSISSGLELDIRAWLRASLEIPCPPTK